MRIRAGSGCDGNEEPLKGLWRLMVEWKGVRSLDGEGDRNKSPEAGFSRLCARNPPLSQERLRDI